MRFVIRRSRDGQYYWELQAGGNWETICVSEMHGRKLDAEASIEFVVSRFQSGSWSILDKALPRAAPVRKKKR